ncbi:MAG: protein kinase [Atopobiaceae bacterium]|nr:protein kinase [Atopobiaceae bacterium]
MDDERLLRLIEHDENYELVQKLAQGPSGITEHVCDVTGAHYVRKRIPGAIAARDAWERLRSIADPRIVRVHEIYELPGELVVVCEWVEGQSLAEHVEKNGPLTQAEACDVVRELCAAVDVLHRHDIVHRDISPTNVIVTEKGPRLIDLGIARVHDSEQQKDTTTLGTWGYAAPEQYGFAQTDARSDVYALGRLLAFCLTGLRPDNPRFDEALATESSVPRPVREVIERACAFEPSARYQSTPELACALEQAMRALGSFADEGVSQQKAASLRLDAQQTDAQQPTVAQQTVTQQPIVAQQQYNPPSAKSASPVNFSSMPTLQVYAQGVSTQPTTWFKLPLGWKKLLSGLGMVFFGFWAVVFALMAIFGSKNQEFVRGVFVRITSMFFALGCAAVVVEIDLFVTNRRHYSQEVLRGELPFRIFLKRFAGVLITEAMIFLLIVLVASATHVYS